MFVALRQPDQTVAVHTAVLSKHFFFQLVSLELGSNLMRHLILQLICRLRIPKRGVRFEIIVELGAGEEGGAAPRLVLKQPMRKCGCRECEIKGAWV